ncbi:uncharacterized protein E0L32_012259 [Thyridium curvatum]|uniref:Major facilitator superfamily (MFS) profile domain-containing protein n=1 Tax=Thyridium curvatum TaxID=1093900 RepID=A0A507BIN1_9PEZI|nr:uncharacterized protein E0L32_012259 [Thyridium curvatum]TPX17269.1 hypothetical protein E0L32_012259 [Thyridium curvatum]
MSTTAVVETRTKEAFEAPVPVPAPDPAGPVLSRPADPMVLLEEEPPEQSLDKTAALRLASVCFAFFVAGVNDGSIGALIPYNIKDYNITTNIVSSVYGASFAGWLVAALTQTHLRQRADVGVVFALGASAQVASQALRVWKPPFPLFAASFFFASVGQAYQDTQGNTFVGTLRASHRWFGLIHGMYAGGCLVGPFVATAIASRARWELFYAVPLGMAVVNLGLALVAFWEQTRLLPRRPGSGTSGTAQQEEPEAGGESASKLIGLTFRSRSVWILSLFYFFYLGAVITASGWVVEYLVTVRHGDLSKMGYVPAGFNGGSLLGRLLLVEPIHRWGTRRVVLLFCVLAIGLQLLFWLVPNIIAASVAISLFGFFTGPFFPVGMSVAQKLFSPNFRPTAMGFLFVIAQLGGSLFPIITGVIAGSSSVSVMQPILVGLMVATTVSWLLVPKAKASGNDALHQE